MENNQDTLKKITFAEAHSNAMRILHEAEQNRLKVIQEEVDKDPENYDH